MRSSIQTPAPSSLAEAGRCDEFKFHINDCGGQPFLLEGLCQVAEQDHGDGSTTQHVTLQGTGVCARGNEYVFHQTESDRSKIDGSNFSHKIELISKGLPPNEAMIFSYWKGQYTAQILCRG